MPVLAMLAAWAVVGAASVATDLALVRPASRVGALLTAVVDVLGANLVALVVIRFVLHRDKILQPAAYLTPFWWKYALAGVLIGLAAVTFKAALRGAVAIVPDPQPAGADRADLQETAPAESQETASAASAGPVDPTDTAARRRREATARRARTSRWRTVALVLAVVASVLGATLMWGTWWFLDFFGHLEPEQLVFNLASPVGGAGGDSFGDILSRPVLAALTTVLVMVLLLTAPGGLRVGRHVLTRRWRQNVACLLSLVLLVGGAAYAVTGLQIPAVIKQMTQPSSYIEANYVDPATASLTFPDTKRNLIHIYYESMESSFTDKEHGGYMEENLLPDLTALSEEGVHFSNTDKPFGGPHQVFGTGWSTAGMTNMDLGVPLKVPTERNAYGLDGTFMPGAWGYTDILHEQGYVQEAVLGCDAHFGGVYALYDKHGVDTIFDPTTARERGLIPPDYNVWWGFEDNKLYDYARTELTNLASQGEPFSFILVNTDTHFPDGFLEPDAEQRFDKQYSNVIFDSQKKMTQFIRWVQEQPFAQNTTIVVTGDHLSMDKNFFADWDPDYERTTFNLFLNTAFGEQDFAVTGRDYASYDYMPTILASLGVKIEGNRLGLGTNLASSTPTLMERDGVETVDEETSLFSPFFASKILGDPRAVANKGW